MADDFCVQHIDQPFGDEIGERSVQKRNVTENSRNWTNENEMAFEAAIGQVWMVNVEC